MKLGKMHGFEKLYSSNFQFQRTFNNYFHQKSFKSQKDRLYSNKINKGHQTLMQTKAFIKAVKV
jgi:hypothetical protein